MQRSAWILAHHLERPTEWTGQNFRSNNDGGYTSNKVEEYLREIIYGSKAKTPRSSREHVRAQPCALPKI